MKNKILLIIFLIVSTHSFAINLPSVTCDSIESFLNNKQTPIGFGTNSTIIPTEIHINDGNENCDTITDYELIDNNSHDELYITSVDNAISYYSDTTSFSMVDNANGTSTETYIAKWKVWKFLDSFEITFSSINLENPFPLSTENFIDTEVILGNGDNPCTLLHTEDNDNHRSKFGPCNAKLRVKNSDGTYDEYFVTTSWEETDIQESETKTLGTSIITNSSGNNITYNGSDIYFTVFWDPASTDYNFKITDINGAEITL